MKHQQPGEPPARLGLHRGEATHFRTGRVSREFANARLWSVRLARRLNESRGARCPLRPFERARARRRGEPSGDAALPRFGHGDRGLRAHRRLPLGRARRQGQVDRLGLLPSLRRAGGLLPSARSRAGRRVRGLPRRTGAASCRGASSARGSPRGEAPRARRAPRSSRPASRRSYAPSYRSGISRVQKRPLVVGAVGAPSERVPGRGGRLRPFERARARRRAEPSAAACPPDSAMGIADYALIGDCHSAALVGRDGSIDWACFPRFDGPAVFCRAARSRPGRRVRGRASDGGGAPERRAYLPDTNVLVTRLRHRPECSSSPTACRCG